MLHIWDIYGKYVLLDGEYALSIQVSAKIIEDEYGECQDFYYEHVKVLDSDGFELEEIGVAFAHAYPGKEIVSTALLRLYDNQDFIRDAKYLQLFDMVVEIKSIEDNQDEDIFLTDRIRHDSKVNPTSEIVPLLACKIRKKSDETVISIKATYCPTPDEDGCVQDEYYEHAQLLDVEGYEIQDVGLSFTNAKPYEAITSTATVTFYNDPALVDQIRYIRLFDAVISIQEPSNQISSGQKRNISRATIKCSICGALTTNSTEICDKCLDLQFENDPDLDNSYNFIDKKNEEILESRKKETEEESFNRCESCQCKLPVTETMCEFCKTHRIKIQSMEEIKRKELVDKSRTHETEEKKWSEKLIPDSPNQYEKKEVKSNNIWVIVIAIVIVLFILKSCL